MRSMPGPGDLWAAPYTGDLRDPRTPDRIQEEQDERTDDGAPEFYDIETGRIDE